MGKKKPKKKQPLKELAQKEEKVKMTREAASRIQAAACRNNNGITPQYSFASRAMRAAYKNEPLPSHNVVENNDDKTTEGCKCVIL